MKNYKNLGKANFIHLRKGIWRIMGLGRDWNQELEAAWKLRRATLQIQEISDGHFWMKCCSPET